MFIMIIFSNNNFPTKKILTFLFVTSSFFSFSQDFKIENFTNESNGIKWDSITSLRYSVFPSDEGLLMNSLVNEPCFRLTKNQFDEFHNFTLETHINAIRDGQPEYKQGIVFAFLDTRNYYYFLYNADGKYEIGFYQNGVMHSTVLWKRVHRAIDRGTGRVNILTVKKINANLHFLINNLEVANDCHISFNGNQLGFLIEGKNNKVMIESVELIHQGAADPAAMQESTEISNFVQKFHFNKATKYSFNFKNYTSPEFEDEYLTEINWVNDSLGILSTYYGTKQVF